MIKFTDYVNEMEDNNMTEMMEKSNVLEMIEADIESMEEGERVQLSPFRCVPRETISHIKVSYSLPTTIGEAETIILLAINQLIVATRLSVGKLLNSYGMELDDKTLFFKLKNLCSGGFVDKYAFVSETGHAGTRFYALSSRGCAVLYNKGYNSSKARYITPTLVTKPKKVKQLLASTQYAVCNGHTEFEVRHAVFTPEKDKQYSENVFRAHCIISTPDGAVVVEAARGDENPIYEKIDRMDDVLKHRKANVELGNMRLVVVCENEEDTKRVYERLKSKKHRMDIFVTDDLSVFNEKVNGYKIEKSRFIFEI